MNCVLENIMTRRSCREFSETPIDKDKMDKILKAAIYAPTGMNKQSWQFTVIEDTKKIQHLCKTMKMALEISEDYNMYNPKSIILVSNDKDNSNGIADCACAMENMMLMASDLKVGTCWINQLKTICDVKEVRETLDSFSIPKNHIVWATLALGNPVAMPEDRERNNNAIVFVK